MRKSISFILVFSSYLSDAALEVVRSYESCNSGDGQDQTLKVYLPNGLCNQQGFETYYKVACDGVLEFFEEDSCTQRPPSSPTPQVGICVDDTRLVCESHVYVTETKYFDSASCDGTDIENRNYITNECTEGVDPSTKYELIDSTSFKYQKYVGDATCGNTPTETITYVFGQCYQVAVDKSIKYLSSDTESPTTSPTKSPTTSPSSTKPSTSPSKNPSVSFPTETPTTSPSTQKPSKSPTKSPTSASPTRAPSRSPSLSPSNPPSTAPSKAPSVGPTTSPTPPTTQAPTNAPTLQPTKLPTQSPTSSPVLPTDVPSIAPTSRPTRERLFYCAGYWGDPHLKRTKIINGAVVETWPIQDCSGSGKRVLAYLPNSHPMLNLFSLTISVSQTYRFWGTVSTIDKLILGVSVQGYEFQRYEIGFDFHEQFNENMKVLGRLSVTSLTGLPSGYRSVYGYKFSDNYDENFLLELRIYETFGDQKFMNVYLCAEKIESGMAKDGCAVPDVLSTNTLNSDGRDGRLLQSSSNRRNRVLLVGNYTQCDGLSEEDRLSCANEIAISSNQTFLLNITAQPACDNVPEGFQLSCDLDVAVTNDTSFANLTLGVATEIEILETVATNLSSIAATESPTNLPTSLPTSEGTLINKLSVYVQCSLLIALSPFF